MDEITNDMIALAKAARTRAYAPYSKFQVGVCVRTDDDTLYSGCNVENASYGLAQCAEASAISNMVLHGYQKIKSIVVIGSGSTLISLCGACRQRVREFADDHTPIYLCNDEGIQIAVTLGDLLPLSFSRNHLGEQKS